LHKLGAFLFFRGTNSMASNMTETTTDFGQESEDAKGEDSQRKLGKYEIHETLGKGAYSWVKRGVDTSNGNIVAMKFLNRQHKMERFQKETVRTEINSLQLVRHSHVIKLLAYNLSAKYPTNDGEHIKTVLLVLEYCQGGELFDLLYYAERLDEITARTYFRQLMLGLREIHSAGIAHRDIKPQNILLDSDYCIKITDFGLSKIMETEEDRIMKTTYVGTRGYQAPELLRDKPYTNACDIFSSGVVLFILVAGYPPFESAHKTDKWYKAIIDGDAEKFWHYHRRAKLSDDVKELITGMFTYKPYKRWIMDEIFRSKWFNGPVLDNEKIKANVIERVRQAKQKRSEDKRLSKDNMQKGKSRDLEILKSYDSRPAKSFPGNIEQVGLRMFYSKLVPYHAIPYINYVLTTKLPGESSYDRATSPYSFRYRLKIDEADYEFSVTAYSDPRVSYTLIHFQTLKIPDSLTFARIYREVLALLSKHDILLDNLPVIAATQGKKLEEEEKEAAKPVKTEHIVLKPVVTKPVTAERGTQKLEKLADGYK